jgi:hypothetical protein
MYSPVEGGFLASVSGLHLGHSYGHSLGICQKKFFSKSPQSLVGTEVKPG